MRISKGAQARAAKRAAPRTRRLRQWGSGPRTEVVEVRYEMNGRRAARIGKDGKKW